MCLIATFLATGSFVKLFQKIKIFSMIIQGFFWGGGGAQWLSGRVLDSRPKSRGFEPHRRHCVVSLSKNINPSLVMVQSRKTRPFITERLLMGRKESNQTNKQYIQVFSNSMHGTFFS